MYNNELQQKIINEINQSLNQSINQPTDQSIYKSVSPPINMSIHLTNQRACQIKAKPNESSQIDHQLMNQSTATTVTTHTLDLGSWTPTPSADIVSWTLGGLWPSERFSCLLN